MDMMWRWFGPALAGAACVGACGSAEPGEDPGGTSAGSTDADSTGSDPTEPGTSGEPTTDNPTTGAPTTGDDTTDATSSDATTGTPPTGMCEASLGDHAADCPDGACPIVVDVEIVCDADDFTAPGLRVHADDASVFVATTSEQHAWLFEIDGDSATTIDELPDAWGSSEIEITRSADGMIVLATDVEPPSGGDEGIHALVRERGTWTEEVVFDEYDHNMEVVDLGIVDGAPVLWFKSDPPGDGYSRAERSDDGAWQLADEPVAEEMGNWPRFRSLDGVTMVLGLFRVGLADYVFASGTGGTATIWPGSDTGRDWEDARVPNPIELGAADLPLPVVLVDREAVAIGWGPDPGTVTDVQGLAILTNECAEESSDGPPCSSGCSIDEIGTGYPYGDLEIVRGDVGVSWLLVTQTHLVENWEYEEGSDDGPHCTGSGTDAGSTAELLLYRIETTGATPELVFSLPVGLNDNGWSRAGMQASIAGDDIAVVLAIDTDPLSHTDEPLLRVLRIDTGMIAGG